MLRISLVLIGLVLSSAAGAQYTDHAGQMDGQRHGHATPAGQVPVEPGQAAFAALAEVVALLKADPETDWSAVSLDALRAHLSDMDRVTMQAAAKTVRRPGTVRFEVDGEGATVGATQRMTLAHAPTLSRETGWHVDAEKTPTGAVMRIKPDDEADLTRLGALGYFGVMTIGAHHQAHHLAIARGADPHH